MRNLSLSPISLSPVSLLPLLAALMAAGIALYPYGAQAAPDQASERAFAAQSGCAGNLLANPTFDGGSRKTEAEGTSLSSAVSTGWSPWFVRGNAQTNREPEFKVEQVAIGGDPNRVRSGGQSMKWFTTWATHDAGIYQRVRVTPGSRLEFSMHAMLYSGEADGWSDTHGTFLSDSAQPGNYRAAVGIDPTGAPPPGIGAFPAASVVWGPATSATDVWVRLTASAVAQSSLITVYARGWPEWPVKHNDSFWEDACLVVTGRGAVQPEGAGGEPDPEAGGRADVGTSPAVRRAPVPRHAPATRVPGSLFRAIPR